MVLSKEQLIALLPEREYWFVKEIAEAFQVTKRTIQIASKKKGIGRKIRQGPNGMYVFQPDDLEALCEHIHCEVGNPNHIRLHRERLAI